MINFSYTIWIPLLPFFMFILLGLAGHKLKPKLSGLIGTGGLAIITVLSYLTAYQYFFTSEKLDGAFQKIIAAKFTWLQFTDKLHIDMGVLLDPISVMMLVVITTVSFMVHIYSLGYMKGEKGFERFFAFLSLFSFLNARTGTGNKYFPDVYFLGTGWCFFISSYRFLLSETISGQSIKKGIYCNKVCRPWIPYRYSYFVIQYKNI